MAKPPVHIFVVENNQIFENMLEYVFTKETRYRFIHFNSGEDCVNNLHLEPDIILLDQNLPGIEGKDVLIKVKEKDPGIHVLFVININDDRHPAEFFDSGADDVVMKPDEGVENIIQKLEIFLRKIEFEKDTLLKVRKKPSLKNLRIDVLTSLLLYSLGFYFT